MPRSDGVQLILPYALLIDTEDRASRTPGTGFAAGELHPKRGDQESTLEESFAILGHHDFLVIFEAPDREGVFETALTLRRHGLSAKTMAIVDTDDCATLVDEI